VLLQGGKKSVVGKEKREQAGKGTVEEYYETGELYQGAVTGLVLFWYFALAAARNSQSSRYLILPCP
jgi:hypothetical protein